MWQKNVVSFCHCSFNFLYNVLLGNVVWVNFSLQVFHLEPLTSNPNYCGAASNPWEVKSRPYFTTDDKTGVKNLGTELQCHFWIFSRVGYIGDGEHEAVNVTYRMEVRPVWRVDYNCIPLLLILVSHWVGTTLTCSIHDHIHFVSNFWTISAVLAKVCHWNAEVAPP